MPRAGPSFGSRASRCRMPTATFDLPMSTTLTWRSTPPWGAFFTAMYSSCVTSVASVIWAIARAGTSNAAAAANPTVNPSSNLDMSTPCSDR